MPWTDSVLYTRTPRPTRLFLDAIGRIDGIVRTQTSIVLSVKFER